MNKKKKKINEEKFCYNKSSINESLVNVNYQRIKFDK